MNKKPMVKQRAQERLKRLAHSFVNTSCSLGALFLMSWNSAKAQPAERLYIANDNHTDYMWTATEAKYDSAFVQMLDYYLTQIDVTRKNPANFQARFNCDGSYWLQAFSAGGRPSSFRSPTCTRSSPLASRCWCSRKS